MSWTTRERERLSALEQLFQDVTAPAMRVVSAVAQQLEGQLEWWQQVRTLSDENALLRLKAGQADSLRHALVELQDEKARLRALLGFAETVEYDYVPAEVVGRNPDNWFSNIIINRGLIHGVSKDDAVVTSQGLVGRVSGVSRHSATVMLALDPDSAIGAVVQRSRDAGVVMGSPGDWRRLHLRMFFRDADITQGDIIVTSGLSHVYPKGLIVGIVDSVGSESGGLVTVAKVRPAVDFDRLEEVLVLKTAGAAGYEEEAGD